MEWLQIVINTFLYLELAPPQYLNNPPISEIKRYVVLSLDTVGENIIATTKIRNNYGAIQSFKFPIL